MKTQQDLIDEDYAEGKKSFQYLWNQILENFEWDRVYQVMKLLDWGWAVKDRKGLCIPNIEALQESAYSLCKDAYDEENNHASGGFYAAFQDNILSLSFIVADWAADN